MKDAYLEASGEEKGSVEERIQIEKKYDEVLILS